MGDLNYSELTRRGPPNPNMPWEGAASLTPTGYPTVYRGREVIRPLEIPNYHPLVEDSPINDNDAMVKQIIGKGCGLASLITENLLIHPFIVLRRQCQVNPISKKYHVVPITLIPVIIRLHQTQGLNTLWKGIGSVLLVRGLTLAVEDLVSKVTPWPKELTHLSFKSLGQHILLKCVSIGVVTPFYSASLVETVQSEVASERPGVLDVFRDGAIRLLDVGNKGRLIPIYALLPPTIVCSVVKYLFTISVKSIASHIMRTRHKYTQESQGAYSRDLISESAAQDIEIQSVLISMFTAEVIFYPFETVIQRLHLQGTRTIIDNLDTGRSVTALLTDYSGAADCYRNIISTEGPLGLYKGFGALIMQFAVHVLVLKSTKWILTEVGTFLRPKQKIPKSAPPSYYEI
ncbi:solute carrier family 25 member 46-like [Copidosoma floridanum]|uniref:solute carrier family 25 member 46-like n=1 Tax=Copidosoma floridanum TaxID=29053 RepID=UPI0006C96AF3|nr:solute carrier family 25 member 46-like [Copidosoma floridanum]